MKAALVAALPLALLSYNSQALQALDESQLSDVTGEGVGVIFDDFSLFTKVPNSTESAEITLVLDDKFTDDKSDDDAFIFSDIRVHRADFDANVDDYSTAGGRFGTQEYPFKVGDLVQVSSILENGTTGDPKFTYTAMHMEFPGGSLTPEDIAANPEILDTLSDPFTLSLQVDSVIGSRPEGEKRRFDFSLAIEGFQFYGFQQDIWSMPYYGLALAGSVGLVADSLVIGGNPDPALSGDLALNNVDLYLPLSTVDQPLVVGTAEVNGKEQIQFEMLPLTKELAAARGSDYRKGHLRIKSVHFGDPRDEALRTGLRPGGDPTNPEDYYYAFQPDVGNTIALEGIEIQHLRITTQDI
jgi:hypothetical protein